MLEWELRARLEILDLVSRYTWCGDFGDAEGFADCFTPDAELTVKDGPEYAGREGLLALARGERTRLDPERLAASGPLHHHVSSVRVELLSESRARTRAYFLVLGRRGPDHWGRYADEVERRDGRWLLHRRRVSVDGAAVGSVPYPEGRLGS